jgi:DNA-binding MarR family transcriptional regulator
VQLEPAVTEIANTLRPVVMRLARELRKETTHLGITGSQVTLLWLISENPGIGLRELADRERIATPTASGLVDRLERAHLVARLRSDIDRRRVGLTITDAGAGKLTEVREGLNNWLTERLEQLGADERATLHAALEPLAMLLSDE